MKHVHCQNVLAQPQPYILFYTRSITTSSAANDVDESSTTSLSASLSPPDSTLDDLVAAALTHINKQVLMITVLIRYDSVDEFVDE